jgi:hypothetical protein
MKLHQRLNCKSEGIAVSVLVGSDFLEFCQVKCGSAKVAYQQLFASRVLRELIGKMDCNAANSSEEEYAAKEIA